MLRSALFAALSVAAIAPAMAQDSALSLTRPVGSAQEVSTTRREGASLALGGGSAPATRAAPPATSAPAKPVETSRAAPAVPASLAASALPTPAPLDRGPVGLSAEIDAYQASLSGGGRPGEITIHPGRTEMVQVARNHLNRFVTPFANPEVQSSAQATSTKVEGSVVYVATASLEPVGLFIVDGDNPANAFSMTLMPREIPPVSMTLNLESYAAAPAKSTTSGAAGAGGESMHVEELRETFRALASGEIPSGYGMRQVTGFNPNMPECVMPGLRAQPAQEITGANVVVIVSKLTNASGAPQVVDESRCASDRVLAVAAWPRVELLPGQSTELYIAVRRAAPKPANARPSVLSN